MTVAFNQIPAGSDFTPQFIGLANAVVTVHIGDILVGAIRVIYDDGTEERVTVGAVFTGRPVTPP